MNLPRKRRPGTLPSLVTSATDFNHRVDGSFMPLGGQQKGPRPTPSVRALFMFCRRPRLRTKRRDDSDSITRAKILTSNGTTKTVATSLCGGQLLILQEVFPDSFARLRLSPRGGPSAPGSWARAGLRLQNQGASASEVRPRPGAASSARGCVLSGLQPPGLQGGGAGADHRGAGACALQAHPSAAAAVPSVISVE